jgi:hypothetical protein
MLEQVGKTYGGTPVLLKTTSLADKAPEELAALSALAAKPKTLDIKKYSWGDEATKVRVYIDTEQFKGEITQEMVDVKFDEYFCHVTVVDNDGTTHILKVEK